MRCWPFFPKLSATEPNQPLGGSSPSPTPEASLPAALQQRFRVGERVGSGGTGVLFRAQDVRTQQQGVLKLLQFAAGSHAAERRRVQRELGKQAALDRQHLVAPLAYGEADSMVWLFREWVDGESLRERIDRQGRLSLDDALGVAMQVAAALDELHRGGLLHRDLKPGHILLRSRDDGVDHAFVIDAGIAARVESPTVFELMGTPAYISPEHAGGKLVSFRSDLYALGCVLFEMLTGHPPYSGRDVEAVLSAHREQPVPDPGVELPAQVTSLVTSLLAKEPRERPFSAQQVRRALQPYAPSSTPRTQATAGIPAGVVAQARHGASRRPAHGGRSLPPPAPGSSGATAPPPPPRGAQRSVPPPAPGARRSVPPPTPGAKRSMPPPPPAGARASGRPSMPPPTPAGVRASSPAPAASRRPPPAAGGFARDAHTGVLEEGDLLEVDGRAAPPERQAEQTQALSEADLAEATAEQTQALSEADLAEATAEQTQALSEADLAEAMADVPSEEAASSDSPQAADAREKPGSHAQAQTSEAAPQDEERTRVASMTALREASARPDFEEQATAAGEPAPYEAQAMAPEAAETSFPPSGQPSRAPTQPSQGAVERDEPQPSSTSAGQRIWDDDSVEDDEMPTQAIPRSSVPYAPVSAADADRIGSERPAPQPRPAARSRTTAAVPAGIGHAYSPRTLGIASGVAVLLVLGLVWAFSGDDEPKRPQVVVTSGTSSDQTASEPSASEGGDEATHAATTQKAEPDNEPSAESEQAGEASASEGTGDDEAQAKADETEEPSQDPTAEEANGEEEPEVAEAAEAKGESDREAAQEGRSRNESRERARRRSRRASRPDPDEVRMAARDAYRKGNYRKAARLYDRATELQPSHAGSYAGLGASLLAMGRARPALHAYQRALRINPQSSGFHAALGRAYFTLGDRARAITAYRKAVQLNPNNAVAQRALKRILRQQ